jgi:hypothetical protein
MTSKNGADFVHFATPAFAPASQNVQSRAYIDALMERRRQNPAAAFDAIARSLPHLLTAPQSAIRNPQSATLLSNDCRARNRPFAFGFVAGGIDDWRPISRPAALPRGHEDNSIQSGDS